MKDFRKTKCKCWSCQLSPKIKKLGETLNPKQMKLFQAIIERLYDEAESNSTDLGVLEAKIEETWPDSETRDGKPGFYHCVGDNLYWIDKPIKVETRKNKHAKSKAN